MLAAYLAAKPSHRPVAEAILSRLEPNGTVGTIARYYIIRCGFRRSVFRGMLAALGYPLPAWCMETPEAGRANSTFTAEHRNQYNEYRRSARLARKRHAPPSPIPDRHRRILRPDPKQSTRGDMPAQSKGSTL